MTQLEFKRNKDNYEINLYSSKNDKRSSYRNIVDKDVNKLAQIFLDLYFEGFPIDKAFKIMQRRLKKKDWLGF